MNMVTSNITRFVKKLEKRGLVKKKKDKGKVKVLLSDEGAKSAKRYRKSYNSAVKSLSDILGDKFVKTTEQLLEHGITLMKNAEEWGARHAWIECNAETARRACPGIRRRGPCS